MSSRGDAPTYLFLHVMKTGGTSLLDHIADNFGPGEVEPDLRHSDVGGSAALESYASMARLRDLGDDRRAEIRVYAGHYPHLVTDLVRPDVTITTLRDPVERAISVLHQARRLRPGMADRPLEEVYEDPWVGPPRVVDYQAKLFAMTADDVRDAVERVEAVMGPGSGAGVADRPDLIALPMDDARLARAQANLERVDVVGLQEHFGELLEELTARFGWRFPRSYRHRTAPPGLEVPRGLRERLTRDLAHDIELYRYAVDLRRRRAA